ncbi:zinc finger protein 664-like isoform X2 [Pungitius pungitius]|uniref:zinc finger protein 664-like isoform X2 n=1 Tax=Pungitius pungitius TaxID=134920 RepID=UPI002E13B3C9
MPSVEGLREFVNERLSAAAEEIFGVFKRTIVEYQEEIDRQRGLLEVFWKPEVRLHRIKIPQSRVCKEEEVLSDQQLCLRERITSLDQEDPDPPQIKEGPEELCSSQDGEQLEPKQETFMLTPTCEERDHGEDHLLDLCTDETQIVLQETSLGCISVKSTAVDEPSNDHQLLSRNSHQSDSIDQKGVKHSLTSSKEPTPPGEKPCLCKKCGKYFKTKNSLFLHVKRAHSVDQPYVCNFCGRRFVHESAFKKHKRVHSDEKPFSCTTCGNKFKCSSSLKVHMHIHTGERPYSCTTCGKTFKRTESLKLHAIIHTGERPYSCITCGKTFQRTESLKLHSRIHTGERPYSCNTCGKTFNQPSDLKKHTRTHTGERPYSCITCGKTFPRLDHLKSHTRIHTGEKPYSCKICESSFTCSRSLRVHMKRHNGETS